MLPLYEVYLLFLTYLIKKYPNLLLFCHLFIFVHFKFADTTQWTAWSCTKIHPTGITGRTPPTSCTAAMSLVILSTKSSAKFITQKEAKPLLFSTTYILV